MPTTKELTEKQLYRKRYKELHKEEIRIARKIYNQKTIEHRKIWNREYKRKRRNDDVVYKLKHTISTNIRNGIIRYTNVRKSNTTINLLGCSYKHAYLHIQKQFRDGMTWENHGTVWHIDHIIPIDFFDLIDLTEQKICFHWGNLQPLFTHENLVKQDNIIQTNFKY